MLSLLPDDTTKKLLHICEQINLKQSNVANYPTSHQQFSAKNLVAFMELRNQVDPVMLDFLKDRGLVLAYTDHILKGLQQTCRNLGISSNYNAVRTDLYREALQRKYSILNTKQSDTPEIMVTMDINTPGRTIKDFLRNGMTIARINCAYGTWENWRRLILSIRQTEKELQSAGNNIPPCKIELDLSGPKIRIGQIEQATYPLKIKVNKDRYGIPLGVKKGILVTEGSFIPSEKEHFDFSLPLHGKQHPIFHVGDILQFRDTRRIKRHFVVAAIHPKGYLVTINKTSYIKEGAVLFHTRSRQAYEIGKLASSSVDIYLKRGDRLKVHLSNNITGTAAHSDNPAEISITLPEAFTHVQIGEYIYFDDGKIRGVIEHVDVHFIIVNVMYPDKPKKIKENKGIHLPDTKMDLPAFTRKDVHDLQFICQYGDFLGVSFIHTADDLAYLRKILPTVRRNDLTIVAKIETKEAINNFSKILLEGLHFPKFAVMVARGDLAIEVGFEKLAVIQQEMLTLCQAAHVPVILATQVLDTLAKKGNPSRSELADVLLGSSFDCMMLNKGPYADKAIDFLHETLQLIVQTHRYNHYLVRQTKWKKDS